MQHNSSSVPFYKQPTISSLWFVFVAVWKLKLLSQGIVTAKKEMTPFFFFFLKCRDDWNKTAPTNTALLQHHHILKREGMQSKACSLDYTSTFSQRKRTVWEKVIITVGMEGEKNAVFFSTSLNHSPICFNPRWYKSVLSEQRYLNACKCVCMCVCER